MSSDKNDPKNSSKKPKHGPCEVKTPPPTLNKSHVKPVLQTIQHHLKSKISEDTKAVIAELKRLLAEAEAGKPTGLIYLIVDETGYRDGSAGCYDRFPTDAAGQLDVLKLKYLRRALDG